MPKLFGVAVIGTGFIGGIHAKAHAGVRAAFPESEGLPELRVVVDVTDELASAAAYQCGFPRWVTDWRAVIDDPQVDVVDICVPPMFHKRIAIAAAQAGKHVYCEKPVGRGLDEALDIWDAVTAAGVHSFVGFNYRWAPAVQYARELIKGGKLGGIRLVNVTFKVDQDYLAPDRAWRWRMSAEHAGWGALGDIGSHAVDMIRSLVGEIVEVCGRTAISVPERPDPDDPSVMHAVDNDDSFQALVTFANGATGVIEACRVATANMGRFEFEIHGSEGAVHWDLRRMNELDVYLPRDDRRESGYTRVQMGPLHNDHGRFNPSPGQSIGFTEMKTIESHAFFDALARDEAVSPNLGDFVAVARVLDAIPKRAWVALPSST